MVVRRGELSPQETRNKLLAKFWVLAKDIGKDYAYECAASLYPRKVSCIPNRGLSDLTIDELSDVVHELWVRCGRPVFKKKEKEKEKQVGQVGRVGQLGQRKKNGQKQARRGAPACAPKINWQTRRSAPTGKKTPQVMGKPVAIPEWDKPANGKQIELIHKLQAQAGINDEYLCGMKFRVMGNKDGELTVGAAQGLIEALKYRLNPKAYLNYKK